MADDEGDVRGAIVRFLRTLGHDVLEAEDGRGVVEAARGGTVDLVITDINMPDMDGLEVINALHGVDAGVPVIAVSGGGLFAKQMLLRNAGALGAFATLEKPFAFDDLKRAVDGALGVASSRSEPEA